MRPHSTSLQTFAPATLSEAARSSSICNRTPTQRVQANMTQANLSLADKLKAMNANRAPSPIDPPEAFAPAAPPVALPMCSAHSGRAVVHFADAAGSLPGGAAGRRRTCSSRSPCRCPSRSCAGTCRPARARGASSGSSKRRRSAGRRRRRPRPRRSPQRRRPLLSGSRLPVSTQLFPQRLRLTFRKRHPP